MSLFLNVFVMLLASNIVKETKSNKFLIRATLYISFEATCTFKSILVMGK